MLKFYIQEEKRTHRERERERNINKNGEQCGKGIMKSNSSRNRWTKLNSQKRYNHPREGIITNKS